MGIIHCIYGLAVGNVANDEHNQPHPTRFFSFSFDSECLFGLLISAASTNEVTKLFIVGELIPSLYI